MPIYFASVRRHNFGCGDHHGISCRRGIHTLTATRKQPPATPKTRGGRLRRHTTTLTTYEHRKYQPIARCHPPGNSSCRTPFVRRQNSAPNSCAPRLHPNKVTAQQSCYPQVHRATHPTRQARHPNGSARAFRWPHRRRCSRTRSERDRRPPPAAPSGEPRQPQTHPPAVPPHGRPAQTSPRGPPQARRSDAAAAGAFNTVSRCPHIKHHAHPTQVTQPFHPPPGDPRSVGTHHRH